MTILDSIIKFFYNSIKLIQDLYKPQTIYLPVPPPILSRISCGDYFTREDVEKLWEQRPEIAFYIALKIISNTPNKTDEEKAKAMEEATRRYLNGEYPLPEGFDGKTRAKKLKRYVMEEYMWDRVRKQIEGMEGVVPVFVYTSIAAFCARYMKELYKSGKPFGVVWPHDGKVYEIWFCNIENVRNVRNIIIIDDAKVTGNTLQLLERHFEKKRNSCV